LHVESVAWIAERKDVLSTLFWLLTMAAYVRYVEKPGALRYMLVAVSLALGLMAKPMLVTLPFVLLLLDYWPLARFDRTISSDETIPRACWTLVKEKLPKYPVTVRSLNALVAYVAYIGKMVWPRHLAVIYPHPGADIPLWHAAGALLLLVCAATVAIMLVRKRPYILVGWLWYIGTLVPVIGLVQVGYQAMADRYTYVPLIGLFMIVSWGVPEAAARLGRRKAILASAAAVVLAAMAVAAGLQLRYWRTSITLFERALSVTSENDIAHNHLGLVYLKQRDFKRAVDQFTAATRANPEHYASWSNLGIALRRQGKVEESMKYFLESLRVEPNNKDALNGIGIAFYLQGRLDEAIEHYEKALEVDPDYVSAHINLGSALIEQDSFDEAGRHFREAIRLDPGNPEAHYGLGTVLESQGNLQEAAKHFYEAVRIRPDFRSARVKLQELGAR